MDFFLLNRMVVLFRFFICFGKDRGVVLNYVDTNDFGKYAKNDEILIHSSILHTPIQCFDENSNQNQKQKRGRILQKKKKKIESIVSTVGTSYNIIVIFILLLFHVMTYV